MQKQAGFTLLEVVIVVAIIGILATVAVPSFMGWTPGYKLKSAVMDLTSSLQYARMRAIKEDRNCSVTFDKTAGTCDLACLGKTIDLSDYSTSVEFSSVSPATFDFTPRGMTDAGGICEIFLADSQASQTYRIRIMPTGTMDSKKQ